MDWIYYFKNYFDLAFTSFEFGVFFLVILLVLSLTSKRLKFQNIFLLFASYLFYASWDPRFLILIMISTCIDYFTAIKIEETEDRAGKKKFMLISLISNLSILAFFKYFNFFIGSFVDLSGVLGLNWNFDTLNIILPVGISFFTFQSMSYTIDIYRGQLKPTRSFLNFALYVSFFPQLVAGPIEKAKEFLPQIERLRTISKADLSFGLYLIVWGLFKKLVVADNLAEVSNLIYGSYESVNGFDVFVGTLAFAFQIYGDFSGYTDIARGAAKMMGFNLTLNFNLPYFAENMSDFWRRWHISLSSWIHQYLYISLGGNRVSNLKAYRNLFISMLLSGLWHGAAYNFIIWGFFHALTLSITRFLNGIPPVNKVFQVIPKFVKIGFTFLLTLYGWMLFRAGSFTQIVDFTSALLGGFAFDNFNLGQLGLVIFYSSLIYVPQLFQYFSGSLNVFYKNYYVRLVFMACLIIGILVLTNSAKDEFIYFQF